MSAFFEDDSAQPIDPVGAVIRCIEQGSRALLIDRAALPDAFFDLSSGIAGELAQKLANYHVRMAGVVPDLSAHSPRFREFAAETSAGTQLRFFATREEALAWLESLEGSPG